MKNSRRSLPRLAAWLLLAPTAFLLAQVPREPIDIGTRPQLFVDEYLVDNHFALIDAKTEIADGKEMVLRTFHSAAIVGQRPVIVEPGMAPNRGNLRYDAE